MGATFVIVIGAFSGLGIWALSFGALGGALLATALVFGISMAQGGITPLRLVLTGVVMSAAFSSVSSFLVFFSADPRATQSVLFWLLGSLSGSVWQQILPSVIVVVLAIAILLALHSWLDALAAGADIDPVRVVATEAIAVGRALGRRGLQVVEVASFFLELYASCPVFVI